MRSRALLPFALVAGFPGLSLAQSDDPAQRPAPPAAAQQPYPPSYYPQQQPYPSPYGQYPQQPYGQYPQQPPQYGQYPQPQYGQQPYPYGQQQPRQQAPYGAPQQQAPYGAPQQQAPYGAPQQRAQQWPPQQQAQQPYPYGYRDAYGRTYPYPYPQQQPQPYGYPYGSIPGGTVTPTPVQPATPAAPWQPPTPAAPPVPVTPSAPTAIPAPAPAPTPPAAAPKSVIDHSPVAPAAPRPAPVAPTPPAAATQAAPSRSSISVLGSTSPSTASPAPSPGPSPALVAPSAPPNLSLPPAFSPSGSSAGVAPPALAAVPAPVAAVASQPAAHLNRMALTTTSDAARADAIACAAALENNHLDTARAKCGEAVAKDDGFALAHLWLAQSLWSPEAQQAEARKALERMNRASPAEQLYIQGWISWREGRTAEARQAYDGLVGAADGEPRAYAARGQLRQSLGDVDGAVADFEKATQVDDKLGAGFNLLGFALAEAGKVDPASVAMHKYLDLSTAEPNAHDSLAALSLRANDLGAAVTEARRALSLDPKFLVAHLTLGDALVAQGKPKEARREYEKLEGTDDPALRHAAAMHAARSFLFEDKGSEAERALIREGDAARKLHRPIESAQAFVEAARIQLDRGALAEAGRGIQEATASLKQATPPEGPPDLDELARRHVTAELTLSRALALALLHERALAEVKAEEHGAQLAALGERGAEEDARLLRAWIALKNGDEAAVGALEKATAPTLRLARAQAMLQKGEKNPARVILDELAHRTTNDLDTALTRPRAKKLLAD